MKISIKQYCRVFGVSACIYHISVAQNLAFYFVNIKRLYAYAQFLILFWQNPDCIRYSIVRYHAYNNNYNIISLNCLFL